ncbi:hypothetical protein SDC9_146352 [bioreactor metagenome]|uniref:Uncharacterized protein n=1 Tax=bioreactor metagenome TaxID=1076179 RepID=A0A645ECT7_9ZZZZ
MGQAQENRKRHADPGRRFKGRAENSARAHKEREGPEKSRQGGVRLGFPAGRAEKGGGGIRGIYRGAEPK